ncbi:hypothetical protein [Lignipirellula cremea]|uniref:hypothetical protein n=1 Tax=Lignipirellula cremea TaxID=2528010 RepID=UPI00119FE90A|nr:hypothetical protein [Lignipirellula cremea]
MQYFAPCSGTRFAVFLKVTLRSHFAMAAVMAVSCLAISQAGCSRAFYREQADQDVYGLVAQKANNPRWDLENYTININPQSRMFDGNSPDCPPMPADDPYSHKFMHKVDGMKGYPAWHVHGDTPLVANPYWLTYIPVKEDGAVSIGADDAVRLALLNSPDYQTELEDLYLSALDVSFERFRFQTQFFAGDSVTFTADGPERRGGGGESSSTLTHQLYSTGPRGIAATKMFSTGADLVVGLANSIVWDFAGPDTQVATTLADFVFTQPLLRRAGRDRVLETLTIAERALLANVRTLERFRRGYYLEIVTGRDAGSGVTRRGGVFGGSGLQGFTGVGGGGFGRLGGSGIGGGTGAGGGNVGGFLGLVQSLQELRNLEANVSAVQASLDEIESLSAASRITPIQVQQARQSLFTAQGRLLNSQTQFRVQLDSFKIAMGLPPQLDIEIEDPLLDRFSLLDIATLAQQYRINELQEEVSGIINSIRGEIEQGEVIGFKCEFEGQVAPAEVLPAPLPSPLLPGQPVGDPPVEYSWTKDDVPARLQSLLQLLDQLEQTREQLLTCNVVRARNDVRNLQAAIPTRLENLKWLRSRPPMNSFSSNRNDCGPDLKTLGVGLDLIDDNDLRRAPEEVTREIDCVELKLTTHPLSIESRLQKYRAEIEQLLQVGPSLSDAQLTERLEDRLFVPFPQTIRDMRLTVNALLSAQLRARVETIELVRVDLDTETALEIARCYRRDWMNARASLVDSWRLIEFTADDLESGLDIIFSGDLQNVGDNPLNLQGTTGRLRARLQFDAPLTRLAERNIYRQSLIEYQQARRSFYQFQDQVAQGLRQIIFNIDLNQVNFELRRQAVRSAIRQLELAQEVPPPEVGAVTSVSNTFARDLLSALTDLQNAQNDFFSVYLSYESLRRSLDYDLGTMQLTAEGLWIDPGPIGGEHGLPTPDGVLPCAPASPFFPTPEFLEKELLEATGERPETGTELSPGPDPEQIPAPEGTPAPLETPPLEAPFTPPDENASTLERALFSAFSSPPKIPERITNSPPAGPQRSVLQAADRPPADSDWAPRQAQARQEIRAAYEALQQE